MNATLSRRAALGLLGIAALPLVPAFGQASPQAPRADGGDQTGALQAAIDAAAREGRPLALPGGRFFTRTLSLPRGTVLSGVAGSTVLEQAGSEALLAIEDASDVTVSGLALLGAGRDGTVHHGGMVRIGRGERITLRDLRLADTALNGIAIHDAAVRVDNCEISGCGLAGLFSMDGRGVIATGNRIHSCGNGGIRVWRSQNGRDGSILAHNRIRDIDWTQGGNGQNGNGINIFRADETIVADNHIADCAFTAIRLNSTNNTQVRGNGCYTSGEVAIFSEFAFSGSVIADNVVDGAAAGISMTNYIDEGRLATCSGNIVRNITPASAVNPDTVPYGIAAEADAALSGNLVEAVPGVGMLLGWGPYLRDVSAVGNLVRDVDTGIAVSVAEGAGAALVANNVISGARLRALSANRWHEVVSDDLERDAGRFPGLTVSGNLVV